MCYIASYGVMLCGVKVKSEQWVLSLLGKMASFSAVLILVGSSFDHWGVNTEKSPDFAQRALFALSDGITSRPADVVEWSDIAGACGLTSVAKLLFACCLKLGK